MEISPVSPTSFITPVVAKVASSESVSTPETRTDYKFSLEYDEEIDRYILTVTDQQHNEVVKQIPPENMVGVMKQLKHAFDAIFISEFV